MVDGVANTTTAYAYDAVNRLVGATRARTGTDTRTAWYAYGYDATGNRTSTTVGGAGTSASFNEADEETSWNIGQPQPRTYTYDANGNELGSSQGESRGYNSRNQTISIAGLNGTLTPIGYLDGGQAERTSAGGSQYLNSSLGVASETKNNQTTAYTRTPSGHLVSQRTAGGTYYYLFDGLGSVVGLVDASGTLQARYGYDPYGQTVVKTGSAADGNPWRYTGAYLDSTGLYKMGARYYDPARGRFTQLDPLGNGYVYASDNPVNFTDPTGLDDNIVGNLFGGGDGTLTINTIGIGAGVQTFTYDLAGIGGDYTLNLNFTNFDILGYYHATFSFGDTTNYWGRDIQNAVAETGTFTLAGAVVAGWEGAGTGFLGGAAYTAYLAAREPGGIAISLNIPGLGISVPLTRGVQ